LIDLNKIKIAVIGLGYVGLPLALEFAKKKKVVGFDISEKRVEELSNGIDKTMEVTGEELEANASIKFTSDENELSSCNCFVVTVPTPIDGQNKPNTFLLEKASKTVGAHLSVGNIVIYESTVYPGMTEELCVPILENTSGLRFNKDFFCGYSPERINPGDKNHKLSDIVKVTSGSTKEAAILIDALYNEIITAGTHLAESIKVAEAAKVIENTQRDINIALINELAIIFEKMDIDTEAVLKAAETKWNFISFRPGLVGGHCIGVDPYYLTYKAQAVGYYPKMILSGREINEEMSDHVVKKLFKKMMAFSIEVKTSRVLLMGLSFKEDCPDIRNSKIVDVYNSLKRHDIQVDVFDPVVNDTDALEKYNIQLVSELKRESYDAIIVCVGHKYFKDLGPDAIRSYGKSIHVLYDLKYLFSASNSDIRL
jgi:UDP-N-acetyl-D-galactosamine dehydrogenase